MNSTNVVAAVTQADVQSIIDHAAKQGAAWWMSLVMLACLAAFVMMFVWGRKDNQKLFTVLQAQHESQINEYRQTGVNLTKVVAENTEVLRDVRDALRSPRQ